MTYIVELRKNSTGEIRQFEVEHDWKEYSQGWWTEGNFGCDCNRHLCFERAAGNEPELDSHPCSHGQYTAIKAILPDGEIVPLDA